MDTLDSLQRRMIDTDHAAGSIKNRRAAAATGRCCFVSDQLRRRIREVSLCGQRTDQLLLCHFIDQPNGVTAGLGKNVLAGRLRRACGVECPRSLDSSPSRLVPPREAAHRRPRQPECRPLGTRSVRKTAASTWSETVTSVKRYGVSSPGKNNLNRNDVRLKAGCDHLFRRLI